MLSSNIALTPESIAEVFDSLPLGVLAVDADYRIAFWNRCLARWTQVEPDEMIGRDLLQCYPHLDEPKYRSRIQGVFQGGPPVVFSSQLHGYFLPCSLKDGHKRIQHTTVSAVRLDQGGYLALFAIKDVTELTNLIQKNIVSRSDCEKETRARKSLENNYFALDGKCQALLEASFDAVLILEKSSGRILEANKKARALYGLSLEPGQNLRYFPELSADPGRTMSLLAAGDVKFALDWHMGASGDKLAVQVRTYQFHSQSSLLLACFVRLAGPEERG